jgi:hypothetical protein
VKIKITEKFVRIATICVVTYLVCFGIAEAFFPVRPFWNDEWRLVYNIKFKSVNALWGTLDLLQECPRIYLTVLKKISSFFDYSYTSLRLPPLVVTSGSLLFIFYLRKKIFSKSSILTYLFILVVVSSQTFTDYIVQVKQYEMDLFLCLVALWQLMTLLELSEGASVTKSKYLLLCLSFAVAPLISYVYPITAAPIFPIILLRAMSSVRDKDRNKSKYLLSLLFQLTLVSVCIVILYCIDLKHVMADDRMYISYIRACYHGVRESFIEDLWMLFSLVGSGFLFEIIFGVLGLAAFSYGIFRAAKMKMQHYSREECFRSYAILLLFVILCLFLSGKLLGGVARLTAYSVPSIAILIVILLEDVKEKYNYVKVANIIATVLFLGLFGNIISTCINTFTYVEYSRRIKTYKQVSMALKEARVNKVPLLFTDQVRGDKIYDYPPGPGRIMANTITTAQIQGVDTLCAEVILKVNPEYKVWDTIPVYLIQEMKWTGEYMKQLPEQYHSAIATDGINFVKVNR